MQTLYTSYENLGISKEVFDFSNAILKNLEDRFREIDETAEFNQLKVIQAMQKNQVSEMHFEGSTGYGYTDPGRDTLEAVFSDVFPSSASVCPSSCLIPSSSFPCTYTT